jgi:hypothetical protein
MGEMAFERGLFIHPSCIWRWVQIYGPELDKLLSGPSETHEQIRINVQDRFLYRAVDSTGQTIEFEKARMAGQRVSIVLDGVADLAGHRGDSHDSKETSQVGGQRDPCPTQSIDGLFGI